MLALHSHETLRITEENVSEFEELAAKSERNFIKLLKRNDYTVKEHKDDRGQ